MPSKESKREKAKEVVDILEEISILLVRMSIHASVSLILALFVSVFLQWAEVIVTKVEF